MPKVNWKGEKAVTSAFQEAIIIRPSLVFGKEDNFFNKFARLATVLPFFAANWQWND
ncbi:sugar nucleotide-binding protein [Wolbachia endosymbiont (group A) of Andrena hattorfiana]|uniref:sugar nucleotide-binding protein n=1 Tax=Wolbachia endosymbiont (group A) of Andrena hattorfiana TaxID=2953977 RepID=UPI0021F859F7|nr:sugar nucleotide-binding protein [Wolbachia endosymbiont (group A) of Andrena hattorfiana]